MIYGDPYTYSEVPEPLRGLAPDPLAMGQANNLYGYTMNNPVNNVDLNGEALITVSVGAIWGGIKLVGGAFAVGGSIGAGANIFTQGVNDGWDNISLEKLGLAL